jgi:ribosomal protein S21
MKYKKKSEKPLSGTTVMVRNGDVNGAMRVLKKRLMRDGFFSRTTRKNLL